MNVSGKRRLLSPLLSSFQLGTVEGCKVKMKSGFLSGSLHSECQGPCLSSPVGPPECCQGGFGFSKTRCIAPSLGSLPAQTDPSTLPLEVIELKSPCHPEAHGLLPQPVCMELPVCCLVSPASLGQRTGVQATAPEGALERVTTRHIS